MHHKRRQHKQQLTKKFQKILLTLITKRQQKTNKTQKN